MSRLKKVLALLILLTFLAPLSVKGQTPQQPVQHQKQALFISSLNLAAPMGSDRNLTLTYLKDMGYNTTFLADGAVTIAFLLHNLGDYSLVIWRTNTYVYENNVYWYLGQSVSGDVKQKYAMDFNAGWLNAQAGMIGITGDFIQHYFISGALKQIRLLIFVGSYGNLIVLPFVNAGVQSVVFCNGIISLQGGLVDDLTVTLLDNLAQGQNVQTAVFNTVSPVSQYSQPQDPIDSTYPPPFWYSGDGTLTLT
jgi:hypothetical protein